MLYNSLLELIGNTPLLRLNQIEKTFALPCRLLAKVECYEPGGSIKDRVALAMIVDAEKKGLLTQGATIIEPTSGNTGIGLAWIAKQKGYRLILTMPDTMSQERQDLLRLLGADVRLTPGSKGMAGSIAEAEHLKQTIPHSIILQQFANPSNPEAHRQTAEEIWNDTEGKVDVLVAGVGTGGTLSGTARQLKTHNPLLRVVAVEPASSPVLRGGKAGAHNLQGIGANFVPANYDPSLTDAVHGITDDEAMRMLHLLAEKEGLFCGISSGASLAAAIQEGKEKAGQTVVVILPDTGNRYLSLLH